MDVPSRRIVRAAVLAQLDITKRLEMTLETNELLCKSNQNLTFKMHVDMLVML